jgi:uncharacterized protein (DUF302 family)
MEIMSYYLAKEVDLSFDDAVAAVTAALGEEGFGILAEIDVQATLATKLGVQFRPYRILGACNPTFAYKALGLEERIGLMLPCNVIVQETPVGAIEVAAIDPAASMQAVDNPALGEIGLEVRAKLSRVIDRVGGA